MPSLRWRPAALLAVTTAAACSLVSTEELQEGTSGAVSGATSTSAPSSGPGPGAGSSANGSTGGDGGDPSAGGGSTVTAVTTSSTGGGGDGGAGGSGGGGGSGAGLPGPCGESPTYADLVLSHDPVAYFRMGPDSATLGTDYASAPHDAVKRGLVESAISPLGALGGCAMHAKTLKGAPALLAWTPPDPAVFGDAGAFSVEMWFVIDELPPDGDARFLFAREYADGKRFHLYVSAGGALYWFFDLGGWRQIGYDDANIVPGALHHAVAIRAGAPGAADEDIYFYYDGRLRTGASGSGDGQLDDNDGEPITMPGLAYSDPADGTFDEIAIYDRVITQDEVRAHYCAIIHDIAICP